MLAQISFLDLVPKRPTAVVTIEGEAGPAEFEIIGVALSQLAEIGRKYPGFNRMVEGGASIWGATDAMPAFIAAGLGHYGDPQYEEHAAQLPTDVMLAVVTEIMRLTFARPTITLPEGEAGAPPVEGASGNGLVPDQTLPVGLNS